MVFVGFLVLIIGMAIGVLCVFIKQMDQALNFSMKKKINVKKIPLYFPNDRKNESKLGDTLENPNEGVYLPTFICSLITYFIVLLAIIYVVLVFTIKMPESIGMGFLYGFLILMIVYGIIVNALRRHYKYKYFDNQEYWKSEIRKKLAELKKNNQE